MNIALTDKLIHSEDIFKNISDVIQIVSQSSRSISTIAQGVRSLEQQAKDTTSKITQLLRLYSTSNWVYFWLTIPTDRKLERICAWISPLELRKRQQDVRSKRTEDTGEWLLETDAFQTWCNSKDDEQVPRRVLACYGKPGAGKTFLTYDIPALSNITTLTDRLKNSSVVIDHLESNFSSSGTSIAYLFCEYQDQAQQTAINMIGSV